MLFRNWWVEFFARHSSVRRAHDRRPSHSGDRSRASLRFAEFAHPVQQSGNPVVVVSPLPLRERARERGIIFLLVERPSGGLVDVLNVLVGG